MVKKEYNFADIEGKWQGFWEGCGLFRTDEASRKEKFYCLVMFPYPSGTLHVGHGRNYIIGDVVARYKMMKGYNVLSAIGWDAFGLPAENAAIKGGTHPSIWTKNNIKDMKRQLHRWGVGYDWEREITSCNPDYYKWTQWIFLKLYENNLAYKKKAAVNWCPSCATVLANEQVVDGCCERCDSPVRQRDLEQWFFRISQYAQRLLDDISLLEGWPERVRTMQANWIGRSEGIRIDFKLEGLGKKIPCFTTRPDTLYGVTFISLAPEHPLVQELISGTPQEKAVTDFAERARNQGMVERTAEGTEKEGVFTGRYVVNPVNNDKVPVWVANYVLMEYGTGAVMGVPAHDQRDFLFAKKYNLPIKIVIQPEGNELNADTMQEAYVDDGIQVNSGNFDGLPNTEAINKITIHLEFKGLGTKTVTYRLRDWLISRQRYWGAPIPIIYCESCGTLPVPESQLPVILPEAVEFKPHGLSPLAEVDSFINTVCPKCSGVARREIDTMDTFVDSSWYFLRYLSPKDNSHPFVAKKVNTWLPVDQYIGGVEHAILHLLYSRFITKVLCDLGLVNFKEPFRHLFTQGMIIKEGAKMSKSRGNVVSPDFLIDKYGADTQRLYILFIGPPQKDAEWNDRGVLGAFRFLGRLWQKVTDYEDVYARVQRVDIVMNKLSPAAKTLYRQMNQTVKKITEDMETSWHFNTAIASVMELLNNVDAFNVVIPNNAAEELDFHVFRHTMEALLLLMAPFTPHICEELWEVMGHKPSIFQQPWPAYDKDAILEEVIEIVVQINSKVKSRLSVPVDMSEDELRRRVLSDERITGFLQGKQVMNTIIVPGKLVNIVVK
ncbi:MAG: leucine--tRNA ligase [Candidatus Brocadia carolinensis]|uniref:Leucine--tRNA ligase n=1 Tax=Candidatus Brocadia carolinensis TaxID=1004156 RepID=A0A1V4AR99_9BACT|nr:MAG: leucine--tRNA ligase [Candidatus Brocadia caroliniensis]